MAGWTYGDTTSGDRRALRAGDGSAAVNQHGGRVMFGTGTDGDFTPTELLLAAIAGCTAIDVDILTSRRARESDSFVVEIGADKVRDEEGNRLTEIELLFRVTFPEGAAGDEAREVLPQAVQRSHDRLCTVGRTVELGTAIVPRIASPAQSGEIVDGDEQGLGADEPEEVAELDVDVLEHDVPAGHRRARRRSQSSPSTRSRSQRALSGARRRTRRRWPRTNTTTQRWPVALSPMPVRQAADRELSDARYMLPTGNLAPIAWHDGP